MVSKFLDGLTPLIVVQALLSVIVVLTFCYQEIVLHAVDTDLKMITFGVVGFWLGGLAFSGQQKLSERSNGNAKSNA